MKANLRVVGIISWCCWFSTMFQGQAQTLVNVDFGAGARSGKTGFAATGQTTNDFWNLYRHYEPRYAPGMPFVTNGILRDLKQADGSPTPLSLTVSNAPGVWGNATGDPMYDGYLFAQDGSNLVVTISGLAAGRYHFFLYGHADPDVVGEQNSVFQLRAGTNHFGPLTTSGSAGWRAVSPWLERQQYVVFRDVPVAGDQPVKIEVLPGPAGSAVLNGLQIVSRGTSPTEFLSAVPAKAAPGPTNLLFHSLQYEGRLSDEEARFEAQLDIEAPGTNEVSAPLFEGEVAVLAPELPKGLRLVHAGKRFVLWSKAAGRHQVKLSVFARIQRAEPWNQVSFKGPAAAIAALKAQAAGTGVELQLLSGTVLGAEATNATAGVSGLIGADGQVALRWQGKAAEVKRKSFVTVDTTAAVLVTPTVIKYNTQFKFEFLQAPVPRLAFALSTNQGLTRLQGLQIRDWQIRTEGGRQLLNVEFIKPVEKEYQLTLQTEQAVEGAPFAAQLTPPQPLEVERESGLFTLATDDTLVEVTALAGLRQVNAAEGILAAYRFYGRPFSAQARLTRMEPVVKAAARVGVRLEETRLLVSHRLDLRVEKAGIYSLDLKLPAGFTVATVGGEGIDDWKSSTGQVRVAFANRVLGARRLELQLEQALKVFPNTVEIQPLRVAGATNEQAEIGVAASPGIRVKTAELNAVREIPITRLSQRSDESLAYQAAEGDWRLVLSAERLAARVVADVFNLVTVGDGLVGGSATFRFGIINQGVQEFRVQLPGLWKNVEFTGPGIRRKELKEGVWIISLQDKVWGAYTLVTTYDFQFDPRGATLALAGAHAPGVERETGSVAITSASGLQLKVREAGGGLRRIDEAELADADRALITRPVLLAFRSVDGAYSLSAEVLRYDQAQLLEAVTDRTQLTTVLTEAGQMLHQASFMVKNSGKQFQKFHLPKDAEFWSCHVNHQPVKAERDTDGYLVPLPRQENQDLAFAVDLVYAQKIDPLKSRWRLPLNLEAPRSDVPGTYAEWQLYIPASRRLGAFGGNMAIAQGTTYGWPDAWQRFLAFYRDLIQQNGEILLVGGGLALLGLVLVLAAVRRGWRGILVGAALCVLLLVLLGMLLPALTRARAKSQAFSRSYAVPAAAAPGDSSIQSQMIAPAAAMEPMAQPGLSAARLPMGGALLYTNRVMAPAAPPPPAEDRPQAAAAAPLGMAGRALESGLRPILIEIPKIGTAYTFTKVLNLGGESLTVSARIMETRTFVVLQAGLQAAVFLGGLWLAGLGWRREPRQSLRLALGLMLALLAVAHLLITRRILHEALILAAPVLAFAGLAWLLRRLWRSLRPRASQPAAAVVLLAGLLLAPAVRAQEPAPRASDPLLSSFQPPPDPTNALTVVSATYDGVAHEKAAQFDAVLKLASTATNQVLHLFTGEVAVQEFSSRPAGLKLVRSGPVLQVWMDQAGEAEVRLKFLARMGGDVTRRQLRFGLPNALYSQLNLLLEESDAEVEFPSAISFKRLSTGRQTRLEAVVGAPEGVDLRWTPRVKRAAEIAATVFCQSHVLVNFAGGVVNTRATLDYQVSQGELRQVRVSLPAGHRLLRVEGESIRTWLPTGEDGQAILNVELLKGISPNYHLLLELEKPLEALPALVRLAVPHALDVKRESGLLAIRGAEELSLAIDGPDLQRVDAGEFARVSGASPEGIASVFRFLKPDFALAVRCEAIQPQVEAVVRNAFQLGFEQDNLAAAVEYNIKKAGAFSLKLALPKGFRLERVQGAQVLQWAGREEPGGRVAEVALKERVLGACRLRLDLVQAHKEVPPTLALEGVFPLGAAKVTGFLSVAAEQGLAVKADTFEGLTEIPAASLPVMEGVANPLSNAAPVQQRALPQAVNPVLAAAGSTLAYKFLVDQPGAPAAWKLNLATAQVEPWVRAEIAHTLTFTETLVSGRAAVRFEIANAPVQEFQLRIPTNFANVDITGPNLRRRDQDGSLWRIELQGKVRGLCQLNVTWEQPRPARSGAWEFGGLETAGTERESGTVALVARPPLLVTAGSATDLLRVDARELPDWAGPPDPATVLAYRYLRPGYRLGLEVKRFEEAEVLQALVDHARLTTVVADDGQLMTSMILAVRNNGRQFLEVELPPGATNWSAFVAGQPVRPSRRGSRLLLPLERSSASGGPVAVELMFVGTNRFPRTRGTVTLATPRLDVPLKNAEWQLDLPAHYRYADFAGTMARQSAPGGPAAAASFSLDEYNKQEWRKEAEVRTAAMDNLKRLRSQLSEGNLKDAVASVQQSKSFRNRNAGIGERDLKQLESDLNRAQASNLLLYQNNFAIQNGGLAGLNDAQVQAPNAPAQQPGQNATAFNFDNAVAEQQWVRLQQAQEVAEAKVQPLRVNLPTRGLRYSFSQVLQTEIGQPMTVQFSAANTRTVYWGARLLKLAGGFLVLWLLAALLPSRRRKSSY